MKTFAKFKFISSLRIVAFCTLVSMSACSLDALNKGALDISRDPIDSELNLTKSEFQGKLRPNNKFSKNSASTNNTSFEDDVTYSPVILAPEDPSLFSAKRVTLSITEDVPVKDVLMELARLSDLELALDTGIDDGIILKVKDRPIKDVIELIADQANLRYNVEHGVLRVQKDGPYLVTYRADYINLNRSSKSTVNTQTQLLATEGNSSGGGAGSSGGSGGMGGGSGSSSSSGGSRNLNSGSTHEITSSSDGDIWKSVEQNISKILALHEQALYKNLDKSDASTAKKDDNNQNDKTKSSHYYTINKQAGVINVMADSKKQQAIQRYLDYVKASISSQVLIEAKIVEVQLNHNYSAGIDWNKITSKSNVVGTFKYAPTSFANVFSGTISESYISKYDSKGALEGVMRLLEGFGTTRTLSNPRINAVNNQQAVLTFAKNQPYFTVRATLQQTQIASNGATSNTPPTITSTLHSIPIGVILTLQPSINLETQEVTMNIRPTLTVNTGDSVPDPAVQVLNASLNTSGQTIKSDIPVVSVKEIDTILKAKSGDVMVIGGLIQHSDENTEGGLPYISRIPFLGNLAKQKNKNVSITETVILIQATIVPNSSNYHPQDRKMYETFIQDSRPLTF